MKDTKPIIIEKTKGDSNLTLNQIKEYKLVNNGKEYLIQLGKSSTNEKIGFKIEEISSEQKIIYGKYISLEELQKISKSFRVFDNIDEALTIIEDIFQENNASIKCENDNIYINLQINKVGKGKEVVEIKLEKRTFSFNEILENDVKNLKNEIEEIKKSNKFLKKEIKYLKDNIENNNSNEKNEIKYLKKEIKYLKEKIENNNSNEKNEINYLKKEIELLKKEIEKLTTNGKQIQNQISDIKKINSEIINKQENLDSKFRQGSLKNNFKSCPHIGLKNIGSDIYMNSTLQCFCHIENFVEFFKYNPQIINNSKNEEDKLSPSFKLLIDNLRHCTR